MPVESNPHTVTLFLSPLFHIDLHPSIHGYLSQVLASFEVLYIPISNIPIRITYLTSLFFIICAYHSLIFYALNLPFSWVSIFPAHVSRTFSVHVLPVKLRTQKTNSFINWPCLLLSKYIVHKPSLDTNTYEHSRCFSFLCKCLVCDGKCCTPEARYLYNLFLTRW